MVAEISPIVPVSTTIKSVPLRTEMYGPLSTGIQTNIQRLFTFPVRVVVFKSSITSYGIPEARSVLLMSLRKSRL